MVILLASLSTLCLILAVYVACGGVNVDTRKVGGLRFVKLGRLTVSFSVSRRYRAIGAAV
jgi:hypothetical protein